MGDTRFRATGSERASDWPSSAPAKRHRNEYEYDYSRDRSFSGVYANPMEDLRLADRGRDRVGVRLLEDHVHAPAPPFLDHQSFVQRNGLLSSSSELTVGEGFNFRSYSHRLDPLIGRRQMVDDDHRLPADASNTLFVEGVPSNCTSREAAHIFRPFRGFKEVRLVNKSKEAKKSDGGKGGEEASVVVVLCFVEFDNPECAATAMEALQGYRFDENDRDSPSLKLQFSRFSNARNRDRNGSSLARDQNRGRDEYLRRS